MIAKLFGEFGNSGEFKTKLLKNEIKISNTFTKNVLIYFSQKFFDFGKVYKIEILLVEPKQVRHDLDSLIHSSVGITYQKQRFNFFYIKNKSIQKNDQSKITFYEEVTLLLILAYKYFLF